MSSLLNLVKSGGVIRRGDPDGDDVLQLQLALRAAGYRVADDKVFGPRTEMMVRQFQQQHGLTADGVVGEQTAAELDKPHVDLVAKAVPLKTGAWPHDDTASLLAFYGKPWENRGLLAQVSVPFTMTYRVSAAEIIPIPHISVHERCAASLGRVLGRIADVSRTKPAVLTRIRNFSGSYNYRPVRGSSRLSCHAFGAALDFDAGRLPLGIKGITAHDMPDEVVDAFHAENWTWGNEYTGRKDPMHFQAAHE